MTDAEQTLRDLWTAKGVPEARQDEMIAEIEAKAQPGAKVGPFTLGSLPVVDGDGGSIDVYGYAATAEEALQIARNAFADPVARVEECGPITLRDGTQVAKAWLAITAYCAARKSLEQAIELVGTT